MYTISSEWLEALSVFAATLLGGYAVVKELREGKARRKGVDASIGADAYVVRRMMRAWVIPMQQGDALGMAASLGAAAIARRDESSAVEERLRRMVAAAPNASRPVQEAVRDAYVLYYKAKGPGPKPPETLADLQAKSQHVIQAQQDHVFADVRACIARLTNAIDPELRDK